MKVIYFVRNKAEKSISVLVTSMAYCSNCLILAGAARVIGLHVVQVKCRKTVVTEGTCASH